MNKKGMTLIELTVVMAILAIFSLAAITILSGVFSVSRRVMASSDAQVIAGNISTVVRDKISFGQSVKINEDGSLQIDDINISDKDGYLTINDKVHFSKGYYLGSTIELIFNTLKDKDGNDIDGKLEFTLTVKLDGSDIYSSKHICSTIRKAINQKDADKG